ncbi:MAG: phosphatase PAP2 family protein [Methanomassiliicoccus sp.]|nr:phosphatase PAP2 family protein [Methanomassiliicoccus sp.]
MYLDEIIFRALNHAGSDSFLDLTMVFFTALGAWYILLLAAPVLWWRKQRELGFDVVVLLIVASLAVEGLKLLIARDRPYAILADVHMLQWGFITDPGGYSMPSGHTTLAFAVATLIALGTKVRWGAVAYMLAALIGLSRVYLGVHWPSDVLTGALLGILLALVMQWVRSHDNTYAGARDKVVVWLRNLERRWDP